MRAAEFLRGLATVLANIENDEPKQAMPPVIVNVNNAPNNTEPAPQAEPESADQMAIKAVSHNPKQEPELQDDPTMVPPLQQKLEIMKKLAGLPNQADTTTAAIADEDEPFEG